MEIKGMIQLKVPGRQVQMGQRPQDKSSHTEPIEQKVGSSLECIGTGDCFLNITDTKIDI